MLGEEDKCGLYREAGSHHSSSLCSAAFPSVRLPQLRAGSNIDLGKIHWNMHSTVTLWERTFVSAVKLLSWNILYFSPKSTLMLTL
jgi:hypothetical protein